MDRLNIVYGGLSETIKSFFMRIFCCCSRRFLVLSIVCECGYVCRYMYICSTHASIERYRLNFVVLPVAFQYFLLLVNTKLSIFFQFVCMVALAVDVLCGYCWCFVTRLISYTTWKYAISGIAEYMLCVCACLRASLARHIAQWYYKSIGHTYMRQKRMETQRKCTWLMFNENIMAPTIISSQIKGNEFFSSLCI